MLVTVLYLAELAITRLGGLLWCVEGVRIKYGQAVTVVVCLSTLGAYTCKGNWRYLKV